MRSHLPDSISRVLVALALIAVAARPAAAQYGGTDRAGQELPWENSWMRVSQISVEPGNDLPAGGEAGRVLVYLTAGPDGRMPAEAVWQPAAEGDVRNRGTLRLEALAIDLKDAAAAQAAGTPPETLPGPGEMEVSTLVNTARVLVTRHRYAPQASYEPLHFHGQDVLVVYLSGGYTWPVSAGKGATPVRRGDVEIIPANTFHTLGNAGGDPLDFLLIVPR